LDSLVEAIFRVGPRNEFPGAERSSLSPGGSARDDCALGMASTYGFQGLLMGDEEASSRKRSVSMDLGAERKII